MHHQQVGVQQRGLAKVANEEHLVAGLCVLALSPHRPDNADVLFVGVGGCCWPVDSNLVATVIRNRRQHMVVFNIFCHTLNYHPAAKRFNINLGSRHVLLAQFGPHGCRGPVVECVG